MSSFYEDLKVAARNLAAVALVTRLHHWVSCYARRLNPHHQQQPLGAELRFLNSELQQDGPVAVVFFEDLEEASLCYSRRLHAEMGGPHGKDV